MTRSTQRVSRKRKPSRLDAWFGSREPQQIRPARVLAARARIASGHYDQPDVKDFLLDALLEALKRH